MVRIRRFSLRTLLIAVTMISVLLALTVWLTNYGAVEVFFSPDTFEFRIRKQRKVLGIYVPILDEQVYRTPLLEHFVSEGYYQPTSSGRARWQFVSGHKRGIRGWRGPARDVSFFGAENDQRQLVWSQDHPELARILWPRVVNHIRDEQYFLVNQLIRIPLYFDGTSKELEELVSEFETDYKVP